MSGEEFKQIERDLREAMQRVEPSAGFAERVLLAAQRDERERAEKRARRWSWLSFGRVPRMAWAAALCVAVLAGVAIEREHRRRVEGEQAKEQLMLALRVTGTKLHQVRSKVREVRIDTGFAR